MTPAEIDARAEAELTATMALLRAERDAEKARVRAGLLRVQARIGEAVREDEDLATWREVLG